MFAQMGFYTMVAVLAAFHVFFIYRFVKKYVPSKLNWLSVFLYVFNPAFLLIMSSAMRQTVAITFFIVSLDYVLQNRLYKAVFFLLVGSLFHASALIIIPFCFVGMLSNKLKIVHIGIIFGVFIYLFSSNVLYSYMVAVTLYLDKYLSYSEVKEVGTGLGVIFQSFIFLFILSNQKFQNRSIRSLFNLGSIAFLFIPLVLFLPMVGRLSMYFQIIILIILPYVTLGRRKLLKMTVRILYILFTLYGFFQFFNTPGWNAYFGDYQTVFSLVF